MSAAKQKSLLFLAAAGALTLILAMSLPNLVLSPGQPFSLGQPVAEAPVGDSPLPGSDVLMQIFQGILALAIILLPVYIIYSLLTAEGRQRLLVQIILFALLLLIADYLHNHPQEDETEPQDVAVAQPMNWDQLAGSGPPALFPAEPPQEFALAVILVVSSLAVAVVSGVVWLFWKRKKSPDFVFEQLAEEAQNAIGSLHAGGDFEMTIIRCYQEMSRVLKEEKGITRETFMTPREFEYRLASKGLPQEALGTLTRLFEQARYSSLSTGTHEQELAVACLTDIVDACRVKGDSYEQR
jgi:hypothetical protein